MKSFNKTINTYIIKKGYGVIKITIRSPGINMETIREKKPLITFLSLGESHGKQTPSNQPEKEAGKEAEKVIRVTVI